MPATAGIVPYTCEYPEYSLAAGIYPTSRRRRRVWTGAPKAVAISRTRTRTHPCPAGWASCVHRRGWTNADSLSATLRRRPRLSGERGWHLQKKRTAHAISPWAAVRGVGGAGAGGVARVVPDGEVAQHLPGDFISVYVPTTPNPTGGYFLLLPRADVIELNMSVDEALTYVISMGSVSPTAHPAPVAPVAPKS